jgi:hypothetical protein
MSLKPFPISEVLDIRKENAEISGRYAAMDVKALEREREKELYYASLAASEITEARKRMDQCLERAEELRDRIEALRAPEVSK